MKTLGLKLTHDGAVAVVENGELLFSVESEKLDNNARYSEIFDISQVERILLEHRVDIDSIDNIVIDGWKNDKFCSRFNVSGDINDYTHLQNERYILDFDQCEIEIFSKMRHAISIQHVTSHIISSYSTSQHAEEPAVVLAWDGSILPMIYSVSDGKVEYIKSILPLSGILYSMAPFYFGPFKDVNVIQKSLIPKLPGEMLGIMGAPGKIMSWIAHGTYQKEIVDWINLYVSNIKIDSDDRLTPLRGIDEHLFCRELSNAFSSRYSEADIMSSLYELLIINITKSLEQFKCDNLILTGGCALNIKMNSAIRRSGFFKNVWVSPFPNDSGNAIGCAKYPEFIAGNTSLKWSVYSGPKIKHGYISADTIQYKCSVKELAKFIYDHENDFVTVLHDKAELGPRALGHRSLMARADNSTNKILLNHVKGREQWRPVAPICFLEDAEKIFDPGTEDKYMLFDHKVRPEFIGKFPAIEHIDGTARLQTVSSDDSQFVFELLTEYKKLSGTSILCNTSANFAGKGFFPDVESALAWGSKYVWCDNTLYIQN